MGDTTTAPNIRAQTSFPFFFIFLVGGRETGSETSAKYEQSGRIFASRQVYWSRVTDPLPPYLASYGGGGGAPGLVLLELGLPTQLHVTAKSKRG